MMRCVQITLMLIASALLVHCGASDPLIDPAKTYGKLTGRIQHHSVDADLPAANTFVIMMDGNMRNLVQASASGKFSFEEVVPGEKTLVFNDLQGNGSILQMVVVGGSENQTGSVELTPLENQPEILHMNNVGYEERISDFKGDHLYEKYSSDGSFAVSLIRLPGEKYYHLIKTDLITGDEQIVSENNDMDEKASQENMGDVLILLSDRYAMIQAWRSYTIIDPIFGDEYTDTRFENVIYDMMENRTIVVPSEKGSELYQNLQYSTINLWPRGFRLLGDTFFYFQYLDGPVEMCIELGNDWCWRTLNGWEVEYCRLNLLTLERYCTAVNDVDDFATFDSYHFVPDGVVFQINSWGAVLGGTFEYLEERAGAPIWKISNGDMQRTQVISDKAVDYNYSADWNRLYYSTSAWEVIEVVDPITGETEPDLLCTDSIKVYDLPNQSNRQLYQAMTDCHYQYGPFAGLAPSPDNRFLAIAHLNNAMGLILDLQSGTPVAEFSNSGCLAFDDNGNCLQHVSPVGFDYYCFPWYSYASTSENNPKHRPLPSCWSQDGKDLLLSMHFSPEDIFLQPKAYPDEWLILHVPTDGSTPFTEEADSARNPYGLSAYLQLENIITTSPDGTLETQIQRVPQTGFSQLFARPVQSKDWIEITFISAQHRSSKWTSSGQALHYIQRDPVSGYDQFFRVVPEGYTNPSEVLKR